MTTVRSIFGRLWIGSPALTMFGVSMIVLGLITGPLALIDPTLVDGQIRWIKPTKFALSFAVYSFSVAWILGYVAKGRLRTTIAGALTATGILEIAVIAGQAARGHTSHFNTSSSLDGALFTVMGIGIAIFFIANAAAVMLAARAKIADRVLATGLKLGFAIASIGMLEGAFMLGPTPEQAVEMDAGRRPARIGAHTVGAHDGGPGLPVVGWSTEAGDLRASHFFGMHALQLIPLAALLIRRRRRWSPEQQLRTVWTLSGAHLGITVLLAWQALRGQPLLAPDALTVATFAVIGLATCLAMYSIEQQPVADRFAEVVR